MEIRPFQPSDEAAVVALWQECKLTRPWNDPHRDIARKLAVQPELFLVGEANPSRPRLRACSNAASGGIALAARLPEGELARAQQ
jgi:hypothetical protein